MKKLSLILLFLVSILTYGQETDSLRMTECGRQLKSFYLGMDILHKWQAGQHINWQTGEPDDPDAVSGIRTHCSAFVAAACERKGIYLLRPPEHKQELLANAQVRWLNSGRSKNSGWHALPENTLYEAQRMADEGYLVIVCAQNTNPHKPGHIALVMPADLSLEQNRQYGPLLIQSSAKNRVDAWFRDAFRHYIADWNAPADHVMFFYNDHLPCSSDRK
ncbi:hypothetical protein [Chryseobacterium hagamense]|uniref:Peptidase C39-like domain-containing protein n=1 Tax=Chryseobacterium hagamense TaxID=395935 RepID=A0A511YLK8_9FLAO|nr:hypothetical protein [Chryseobacterium hagamense]GEN76083.1 hypothetical protein CHA01nite_18230 [Chryseobacterium hagamense]